MSHIIVGTAGHIDHGKTALVRALTGIDTDRLKEEKARGISIDLGFAHLDLGDGVTVGFVDVPGHERFVRNMLAGATGIDLVLLVVAADESVMPQTREHFAICRMLGIERGVVALTKVDLADEAAMAVTRDEVEHLLRGSPLEGAPMLGVSSVTGAGLDELRLALADAVRATPGRDAAGLFRLPVDRVFTMHGFGAVATGTVAAGRVRAGDEIEIYPENRRARVRGIQVHSTAVNEATAGQRAALNLSGVDLADLRRGLVAGAPGLFRPSADFGARVELLHSAPPFRNRSPVQVHAGAAEIAGEIRFLDRDLAEPDTVTFARIVLRSPALLLPGDRFVLRRSSPAETVGGGVVLDPHPEPMRRAALFQWLSAIDGSSRSQRLLLWADATPHGISRAALVARSGEGVENIRAAGLLEVGDRFLTSGRADSLRKVIGDAVLDFHRTHPLAAGMSKEELRSRALPGAPPALFDFLLRDHVDLTGEGELVRRRTHARNLSASEANAEQAIEDAFARAGLAAPDQAEVLAAAGVDAKSAQTLLQGLLRKGRLVRINADLLVHASALESLRSVLAARRGARFGVPEFKGWTGVSRKFAIPLLEYCDRQRITRREGDSRLVL